MEFFLDSSNLEEISEFSEFIDGVTTNPTLLSKVDNPYKTIEKITEIISGPVSLEVISTTKSDIINEIDNISKIAKNIVVKIPLTTDGLIALKYATSKGIKTNLTLCFSETQAVFAAKFGATYVSPFIGRLDDLGLDGINLIYNICEIFNNYNFNTKVLSASVRSTAHVVAAMKAGSDAITVPAKILKQMLYHPLTDIGLDTFLKDWNKSKK